MGLSEIDILDMAVPAAGLVVLTCLAVFACIGVRRQNKRTEEDRKRVRAIENDKIHKKNELQKNDIDIEKREKTENRHVHGQVSNGKNYEELAGKYTKMPDPYHVCSSTAADNNKDTNEHEMFPSKTVISVRDDGRKMSNSISRNSPGDHQTDNQSIEVRISESSSNCADPPNVD